MMGFVRRVVTGHDRTGKALVISDGLTPTLKTNPLRPGHRSTEIWRTNATPAPIAAEEADPTVDGPHTMLDEEDVNLKTGDVVIQRGTNIEGTHS